MSGSVHKQDSVTGKERSGWIHSLCQNCSVVARCICLGLDGNWINIGSNI